MKIDGLIRYDIPAAVVERWRETESGDLLPLQELAVKRGNLFGGENLLIQAPTSSGKTFVGEMAAIHTALRKKQVVYLVPLKALAEEKFRAFRDRYTDYGLRVILSTRDHREFDQELERGHFSIAVVVYEKLAQLLVRRPERAAELDLVIADELELLSDPDRGAGVELLLTRLLASDTRIIGLSAVIGGAEKLARWMNATLLQSDQRPVELRYGVLYEGTFRYRTYNQPGEGVESLMDPGTESAEDALIMNLRAFVERGESSIVFVRAKHDSRRGAERIASELERPPATEALAELSALEPTRSRDALMAVLARGVAFHNADLSPEERHAVEAAFRRGEVLVLVSTSTLAVGLNLPAHNVFATTEKWRYDSRLGTPWKTPVLHTEYENMGGRAGRYGTGLSFGRSILVASSPFEYESCWRNYVEGERESIQPQLARGPLDDHVLRLVAARQCRTLYELVDLLDGTLSGKWVWSESCPREELAVRARAALHRSAEAGMVLGGPGDDCLLRATPLGSVVAASGIELSTAREILVWLSASTTRPWCDADVLLSLAATPDGRQAQVMLTTREYEEADYVTRLKAHTWDEPTEADVPLNRIRTSRLQPFFEEVRAVKVTLMLLEWIDQRPLYPIEEDYNTMAGQILAAAAQLSWLLDAAGAMATALGLDDRLAERLTTLAARTARGLRAEWLPPAREVGLTRAECLALAEMGLDRPEDLARATDRNLETALPPEKCGAVRAWAEKQGSAVESASRKDAPDAPAEGLLIIDDGRPNEIVLEGRVVALQAKQFQLIRLLATRPGECVPYDTIYQQLWGEDVVVEPNQIHYQKRILLQRVGASCPGWRERLIETRHKYGFALALTSDQVRCTRREQVAVDR